MDFIHDLENSMKYYTTKGGFLTAKGDGKVNTMTVSWGFVGFFWSKPYFVVGVRPERYTKKILDSAVSFTISIPYGRLKNQLNICGTQSGINIDKSKTVTFKDAKKVDSPIVSGCDIYYECKINYVDNVKEVLLPTDILEEWYTNNYHILYFGEIVECYKI